MAALRAILALDPMLGFARAFAYGAHEGVGHRRKYTGAPYGVHLDDVAKILYTHGVRDTALLAAAFLHDTLEDTGVTRDVLVEHFGEEVAALVEEVTDVSRPDDGNRRLRKALDREHLANASRRGMTLKLADLISNTHSITRHDPGFARVYLEEKRLLLPLLNSGDRRLWEKAASLV